MKRLLPLGLLAGIVCFFGTGCGDDDGHGHTTGAQSCQDIIDACHDVDPGMGTITDCHDTAHDDGTAAACDPIRDNCVAMCEALAGDGGTYGDGGAHGEDGGAHSEDGGAHDGGSSDSQAG